ncbi:hypothetical protein CONPUDRAFT_166212 [Coniophora puteana RWD-64-598 SS2]|uniref:FAD-binding domain-containing protein n=1 Tax=Coniophora puteana (strain RWD-64-598) TaxID=741705 RepID=A0A5M3MNT5_CONPW|nr:uncharacterized protein CONPUDRAFT_166212 [Coniophora puteana RWD-64-598 SS2]EIW80818.1 hypothetical protein CONPUDRAFT_166212 [Coniophora puteana RWD-64-598 SS2]
MTLTSFYSTSTPQSTLPVLVVGAGPVGLVAALTLARNGIPVRIIDKLTSFHPGSRGPAIQPRTQELLHQLGAEDMLRATIKMPPIRTYAYGTMDVLKTWDAVPLLEPTRHIPYANPRLLGQNGTEKMLRAHLSKYGVKVELGHELRSIEQGDNYVVAHTVKRDGSEATIRGSYLIGADGGRGACRKQLGMTFLGTSRKETPTVTGDVRMSADGLDTEHWHRFGTVENTVVMLRHCPEVAEENDGWQYLIQGDNLDVERLLASKEAVFNEIAATLPMKVHFTSLVWSGEYRPNIRMVDRFSVGRAFLAGDAAHVHSPVGGQGLNTGIHDAINLAWKLMLVVKGKATPSLLDTYSAERLPLVAEMLNITTGLLDAGAFGSDAAWQPRPESLRMLGINYRTSSIVLDEINDPNDRAKIPAYGDPNDDSRSGRGLVAGDRAPEAAGLVDVAGGEHRLFDIFGMTHHTVLVFAPSVEAAGGVLSVAKAGDDLVRYVVVLPGSAQIDETAAAESRKTDGDGIIIVHDSKGIASAGYQTETAETRAVIVRPDGWIGGLVRDADGVRRYFTQILA